MQNLWDTCLRRLEQELPAQQFNTWIRPLAPEAGDAADTLILAAPNRFVLELVRERFAARIERLATEASGRELGLRLVLARAAEAAPRAAPAARSHARNTLEPRARPAQSGVLLRQLRHRQGEPAGARRRHAGRREPRRFL